MRIAFLNLCHCDPDLVCRAARRLTEHPDFDMLVHVDAKADIAPFEDKLRDLGQVNLIPNRHRVYWGGFNAVAAMVELMRSALASDRDYRYLVMLQNLDYPIKSNAYIERFFSEREGTEFIRGCPIANTRDWHYARKYKIYNSRDDDFYLKKHSKARLLLHYLILRLRSVSTFFFDGVVKDGGREYPIYYGTAQFAVTRECARHLVEFFDSSPEFNRRMSHIQFPDEEYFHTVVHNSDFKYKCSSFDEPEQRWLVNWRNLHYFEYPKEITVFDETDFDKLMSREELFIRKVRTGKSDKLLELIDNELDRESSAEN